MTKGNVYIDGNPICDEGWSRDDASVACRYQTPPFFENDIIITIEHNSTQNVGIWSSSA